MSAALEFVAVRAAGWPEGLSFTAPAGQMTGVLGQNGGGIEQVMALAAGALRPEDGRILLGGAALAAGPVAVAGQGVARCARHPRAIAGMTVLEQAMTGGFLHRGGFWASLPGRRAERPLASQVHDLLALVGLVARAEEPAVRLRQAELWRLELARAMAARPRLLLLEAPAAALRPADSAALGGLLRGLCAAGLTVLVGEHNMGFVAAQCDHAVVLRHGRKIAEGAPQACLEREDVQEALFGRQQDADRLRARR